MKKDEAMVLAARLIQEDDNIIYDACASIGQIVGNVPPRALVRIVAEFLMEDQS